MKEGEIEWEQWLRDLDETKEEIKQLIQEIDEKEKCDQMEELKWEEKHE